MPFEVIDLFCGVGGLTCGMRQAGFHVVAGFDNDQTCEYTYSHNNHTEFHCRNIKEVTGEEINSCYSQDAQKILVGCAPCQPFSTMSYKRFVTIAFYINKFKILQIYIIKIKIITRHFKKQ